MKRLVLFCLHLFVAVSFIFISTKTVSASTIISTFHDDFDRPELGLDYFYGTNSYDSFHIIDNGILTINSGSQDGGGRWIKSNTTYAYSPGSNSLIFETRAKIGQGERHFAVGLIGDNNDGFFGFGDLHATHQLESSTSPASTGGLIQDIDQVDISEWHTYRIEVICSTANYYVDGILRSVDNNPNDIPFNKPLRIVFDKGSQGTLATLSVDYVDLKMAGDSCSSDNHPPQISSINAPITPMQLGQSINATVEFSDPDVGDTHTVQWTWGDGLTTTSSATVPSVTTSHTYTSAAVYTVTAIITDAVGESDTETFQYVVIYDANGGFVTGGGWITSPLGAYTPNPSLIGKATFGFVSKYQKGANVPTGNTEFQFHLANLNFKSTSYDWLVIAGTKAQYKGTGTINDSGNYGFMLTIADGTPDKFRIKIWDKVTGNMIYDNQLGGSDNANLTTAIQGGSIVIHK